MIQMNSNKTNMYTYKSRKIAWRPVNFGLRTDLNISKISKQTYKILFFVQAARKMVKSFTFNKTTAS